MEYATISKTCDLWLFDRGDKIVCKLCTIADCGDVLLDGPAEALRHATEHQVGHQHQVPISVFERLREALNDSAPRPSLDP